MAEWAKYLNSFVRGLSILKNIQWRLFIVISLYIWTYPSFNFFLFLFTFLHNIHKINTEMCRNVLLAFFFFFLQMSGERRPVSSPHWREKKNTFKDGHHLIISWLPTGDISGRSDSKNPTHDRRKSQRQFDNRWQQTSPYENTQLIEQFTEMLLPDHMCKSKDLAFSA